MFGLGLRSRSLLTIPSRLLGFGVGGGDGLRDCGAPPPPSTAVAAPTPQSRSSVTCNNADHDERRLAGCRGNVYFIVIVNYVLHVFEASIIFGQIEVQADQKILPKKAKQRMVPSQSCFLRPPAPVKFISSNGKMADKQLFHFLKKNS